MKLLFIVSLALFSVSCVFGEFVFPGVRVSSPLRFMLRTGNDTVPTNGTEPIKFECTGKYGSYCSNDCKTLMVSLLKFNENVI